VTSYVALLRGVNVGGRALVAMSDLRTMLAELGFDDVQSLLQSGNLVFRGGARKPEQLETSLAGEIERRCGLRVDVMIRTAAEWAATIERNPYADEASRDPARLIVLFLKAAVKPSDVAALQSVIKGRETVRGTGRELYAYYPDGQGTSKFTIAIIEKTLRTRTTGRNWNTVLKIAALAGA
jgi:uncharacterized protein (DUF1697 family)